MTIESQIQVQNKITNYIDGIVETCKKKRNLNACRNASQAIDLYESEVPEDKEFVKEVRNYLCDQTFAAYAAVHNSNSN